MPRTFKINEHPNPTGLRIEERRLALDVLRSFEDSVTRERNRMMSSFYWRNSRTWDFSDEEELRRRVYRTAYSQLTGRVKSEGSGLFRLSHSPATTEEDMDYVLTSLGMKS